MADKKKKEVKLETKALYKGYEINWLRTVPEHPDFYLVEEFDKLGAKGGEK